MMGSSHKVIGAATGFAVASHYGGLENPVIMIGCILTGSIGALIPDIDHAGATISKKASFISRAIRLFTTHRGMTHSAVVCAALVWYALKCPYTSFTVAFAAGYASHACADMLTKDRVQLLWPISKKKVGIPLIGTGSLAEPIVVGLVTAVCFAYPFMDQIRGLVSPYI